VVVKAEDDKGRENEENYDPERLGKGLKEAGNEGEST